MTDDRTLAEIKRIVGVSDNELLLTRIHYDHSVSSNSEELFGVYVVTDSDGYVTQIDSDAYLTDLTGWIKIDEGRGDLYHFAKTQYCKYGLSQSDGSLNYRLIRGRLVYEPKTPIGPMPTVEERLTDLETAVCEIMDILAEM